MSRKVHLTPARLFMQNSELHKKYPELRTLCAKPVQTRVLVQGVDYAAHFSQLHFAGDEAAFVFQLVSVANAAD
jgi:hypothetical protein